MRLSSIAAFGVATLLFTASGAGASPITSFAGLTGTTATIDFSQFTGGAQLSNVSGPVQIGGLIGADVTVQDMSSANLWLYNATWGLGSGNGTWDSGQNGFLGLYPGVNTARITFNDGPISGFAVFMNYPVESSVTFLPQILRAYDSSGNLLETFDVAASAPISTPGGLNAGAVRGIQLGTANIAYIEFEGNVSVYDNLTFTTAPSAVPEPGTLLLLGTGVAALVARRRLKARG